MKLWHCQATSRTPFILCLFGILLVFITINARWLWLFRHGQPFNIDEAGYLGVSLVDYFGFARGGIRGFVEAIETPSGLAPLTSALAALLYVVTGPHVIVGFAVPLAAGTATIAATYFLGASLGSRSIGLISAALVASCPMTVWYARIFQFSLPATFLATMALLALLRSDRCRHFGWACVFGVCLGLMPLARTMTIAFVPGILLGAGIYTVIDPLDRRRRMLVLAWSLLLALATAATWFGPNGRYVFQYLLSFGYGNHAAEFGPDNAIFSFANCLSMVRIFVADIHVPHFLIISVGALSLLLLTGHLVVRNGGRASFRIVAFSPLLPIVIYIAAAVAALASSQNKGDGFCAPFVPAAIVLAVWSCGRISHNGLYRLALASLAVCVAVLVTMSSIDEHWAATRPRLIDIPILGPSIVTDGRGSIQLLAAVAGGSARNSPTEPLPASVGKAWVELNATTATAILQAGGVTAFGFRHMLYNVNTVHLEELIGGGVETSLIQIDPIITGDSVAGDVTWLTHGDAAAACLLLTSDDKAAEFSPAVDNGRMVTAATQVGFQQMARWTMPNGHDVTMWRRQIAAPNC